MKRFGARQLPIYNIGGTDFYADGRFGEFREVGAPHNVMRMVDIILNEGADGLLFDKKTKNIYFRKSETEKIPPHVVLVRLPSMYAIDPVGVARRYGKPDDYYQTDKGQDKNKGMGGPKR